MPRAPLCALVHRWHILAILSVNPASVAMAGVDCGVGVACCSRDPHPEGIELCIPSICWAALPWGVGGATLGDGIVGDITTLRSIHAILVATCQSREILRVLGAEPTVRTMPLVHEA